VKGNRVVEEELRCVFEGIRDSIPTEVPVKRARYIGEYEANIFSQGLVEDGGQCSECIIGANSNARDSAIGEDENGSNGVDVLRYQIRDTLLVELIVLNTASIGQSRCIEDANLTKMLRIRTTVINTSTYHYSVLACEFVEVGRIGLALVVRTTLLVAMVKGVVIVVIDVVAMKDVSDEFQE